MRRVVVPPGCIEGERARLEGALHHHLVHVLRLRPGAELLLLDGTGCTRRGRLQSVDGATAVVLIEETLPPGAPAGPRLTLIYGLSRRARTEWVLQKATELGADAIALARCQRSVARGEGEGKRSRWEEIVRQAARQCGRPRLPELLPLRPLEEVLAAEQAADLRLLAHAGKTPLSALEGELGAAAAEVALAVGPEGGFSDEEVERAEELGFRAVGLGPHILRTETAAVVLLALAAYLSGRLDGPQHKLPFGTAPV